MKKALFLAPFAAALFACGGQEPSQVSGLIVDATMNTVSVAVQGGDTLSFSTLEAERIGPDGMLLGDTATVFFQGEAKPGEMIPAARLEVRPRPRLERIITGCGCSLSREWTGYKEWNSRATDRPRRSI